MLKKIIKQIEDKIQIGRETSYILGLHDAISIIKQHESEFEEEIIKACSYDGSFYDSPQDYYNQNYKNE